MTDRGSDSKYVITHFCDKKHNKDEFTCGAEALRDRYLQTQAGQDIQEIFAVTYIIAFEDSEEILGYYRSHQLAYLLANCLPSL